MHVSEKWRISVPSCQPGIVCDPSQKQKRTHTRKLHFFIEKSKFICNSAHQYALVTRFSQYGKFTGHSMWIRPKNGSWITKKGARNVSTLKWFITFYGWTYNSAYSMQLFAHFVYKIASAVFLCNNHPKGNLKIRLATVKLNNNVYVNNLFYLLWKFWAYVIPTWQNFKST